MNFWLEKEGWGWWGGVYFLCEEEEKKTNTSVLTVKYPRRRKHLEFVFVNITSICYPSSLCCLSTSRQTVTPAVYVVCQHHVNLLPQQFMLFVNITSICLSTSRQSVTPAVYVQTLHQTIFIKKFETFLVKLTILVLE